MTGASPSQIQTTCCVVGGGPAGIILGYLLARAGIDVIVLEKHADFLRDFRGDTIHPATLEILYELGLLDQFLALPHDEARQLGARVGNTDVTIADFTHLPTHAKFLAFMPQWDFLNFFASQARQFPCFQLLTRAQVVDLLRDPAGTIVGVRASAEQGEMEIRAHLTVACDGRHSIVRQRAQLPSEDLGAPMDVLWLRLSRREGDPTHSLGRIAPGHVLIQIDRGTYWQCAFLIAKGGYDQIRQQGLAAFQQQIVELAPYFSDRVGELRSFDDVSLLTVAVDRLTRWYRPGLLCIGDAAHAMSPIGGVGINLAIQDAVATANLLAGPLSRGAVTEADLDRVQQRRNPPTRVTQRAQVFLQNRVIRPLLESERTAPMRVPLLLRMLNRFPRLRRVPAQLIGIGVRPEHVHSPRALDASTSPALP